MAESRATSVRGQVIGKGSAAVRTTSVRGQVIGKGSAAVRTTSVRGQVMGKGAPGALATSLRGQVLMGVPSSKLSMFVGDATVTAVYVGDVPVVTLQ